MAEAGQKLNINIQNKPIERTGRLPYGFKNKRTYVLIGNNGDV
jgi:hypothetical protein